MASPYITFSSQDIANLVTYRKNPNSVLNAHRVFNQMGQGCSQHLREDSWPAFSSSLFPFFPRRGGWGPEQHWTVTRVRRVLIPGLKAGVWQTSIHGTSKTNIGPSWRQGAHNGASRWKLCDAAPKSPDPDTEDLSVSTQLCHLLWLSLLSMPVFALWMSQAIENYIPLFCYFSLFSIIYPPR